MIETADTHIQADAHIQVDTEAAGCGVDCCGGVTAEAPEEQVPLAELEAEICRMAGHLSAGTCAWLAKLAEFDRREGWAGFGMRSFAQWLSWKCGIGEVAAREYARVGRALEGLPLVRAAFAAGELSYSKVRALTRIATAATEADLVMMGRHSTAAQMERIARGHRQAVRRRDNTDRHDARRLTWGSDEDGGEVLRVRLDPEQAALVRAALGLTAAALAAEPHGEHAPGPQEGAPLPENERPLYGKPTWMREQEAKRAGADALVAMAESVIARGGPVPADAEDRATVVVHADLAALQHTPEGSGGEVPVPGGHLEAGVPLHPDTVLRFGCDAALIAMVHGSGGTVLDVGRKTRVISTAMRRALRFRDKGCRFPGCTNTRWVDAHHIVHWVRGGRTDLANLILLCRHHHRVVHEGGYTIGQPRPGRFTFTRPDGTLLPHAPEPAAIDPDAGPEHLHDARIAPDTITGHWAGEHLDLGLTVAGLLLTERLAEQRAS